MSTHRVTIEREPGGYRAICVCRARSHVQPMRWQVEDWQLSHLNLVDRVRTHLSHGKSPSLASQRDYFRAKAEDPNTPKDDVSLWKMLADELDRRLGSAPQPEEQQQLW